MMNSEGGHNWVYDRPTTEAACMGAIERSSGAGAHQRPGGRRYVGRFAYFEGSKPFARVDKSESE